MTQPDLVMPNTPVWLRLDDGREIATRTASNAWKLPSGRWVDGKTGGWCIDRIRIRDEPTTVEMAVATGNDPVAVIRELRRRDTLPVGDVETAAAIDALLRRIEDLEQVCDPAGDLRQNRDLKQQRDALAARVRELDP